MKIPNEVSTQKNRVEQKVQREFLNQVNCEASHQLQPDGGMEKDERSR